VICAPFNGKHEVIAWDQLFKHFTQFCVYRPMVDFGPFKVAEHFLVYKTSFSYVSTNLKPILEGHLLVCPIRCVPFLRDLTPEERADLFATARIATIVMKNYLSTEAIQVTCQDGPIAGQTVPHVHLHIIPRHLPTKWTKSSVQPDEIRISLTSEYAAAFQAYLAAQHSALE
jgi:bis(5'-adenosyl)-triphosphatase